MTPYDTVFNILRYKELEFYLFYCGVLCVCRRQSGLNESIQGTTKEEWPPFDESASLPQKLKVSFLMVKFRKVTDKRLGGDDCKDRQSATRVVARMSPPPFSYYSAGTDQCQKV